MFIARLLNKLQICDASILSYEKPFVQKQVQQNDLLYL